MFSSLHCCCYWQFQTELLLSSHSLAQGIPRVADSKNNYSNPLIRQSNHRTKLRLQKYQCNNPWNPAAQTLHLITSSSGNTLWERMTLTEYLKGKPKGKKHNGALQVKKAIFATTDKAFVLCYHLLNLWLGKLEHPPVTFICCHSPVMNKKLIFQWLVGLFMDWFVAVWQAASLYSFQNVVQLAIPAAKADIFSTVLWSRCKKVVH